MILLIKDKLFKIESGNQIPFDEYKKRKNLGRNDKCYCESGKKYKKCCLNKDFDKYKFDSFTKKT